MLAVDKMDTTVTKGTARTSATSGEEALVVPGLAYSKWYRTACRLRRKHCKTIGIVAVGPGVSAAEVALCLAPPLMESAASPIAVLLPAEEHEEVGLSTAIDASVNVLEAPGWPPDIQSLVQAVASLRERHAHVLVPLSSLELDGDPLPLADFLDGVVIVGRAGKITEGDLLKLRAKVVREKQLGVLLLDS
jgi:hypothetical protein